MSRSWIYTQPQLVEQIAALAPTRPEIAATRRPATQRASEASLKRRLKLADQRFRQLTAENNQLRDELARTHGRLRARD